MYKNKDIDDFIEKALDIYHIITTCHLRGETSFNNIARLLLDVYNQGYDQAIIDNGEVR